MRNGRCQHQFAPRKGCAHTNRYGATLVLMLEVQTDVVRPGACAPPLISFKLCTFSAIRIFWKASKTFGARKLVCSHKKSLRLSSHFGGLWVPNVQLFFLPKAKGQNIQPYLHSLTHWRTEVGGESSMQYLHTYI